MENQQDVPRNEEIVGPVEHLNDMAELETIYSIKFEALTSKKPLLRTQGREQITIIVRNISRRIPVIPAVPNTQPNPVFT